MRRVVLFAEDFGHETFLRALIERVAREYHAELRIESRSTVGGAGQMATAMRQFLRSLDRETQGLPDALIVARDANCRGYQRSRSELEKTVPQRFKARILYAIPDPHIERWLLMDASAFKRAVGKGCSAPDYKCEKGRYKRLLREAVRDAGVAPLLGGIEHADAIVQEMELSQLERADSGFKKLLEDLRNTFKLWSHGPSTA